MEGESNFSRHVPKETPMYRTNSLLASLAVWMIGCSGSIAGPTPPPSTPDGIAGRSDVACQYQCSTYHYVANQCYGGWQCDAAGSCLSYVGTPANPSQCPSCVPTTCAAQKITCGSAPDGCGGTLDCGTCTVADPFDPSYCSGAAMTIDEEKALLNGSNLYPLGKYTVYQRNRTCNSVTGCTPWLPATVLANGNAALVATSVGYPAVGIVDSKSIAQCSDPRQTLDPSDQPSPMGFMSFITGSVSYASFDWDVIGWLYGSTYEYGCSPQFLQNPNNSNLRLGLTGKLGHGCFRADLNPPANATSDVILRVDFATPSH
jgi:hypothetical protein